MSEERCCGCVSEFSDQDYDMSMHVGATFIIFAVSLAGSFLPVAAQKIPRCSTSSMIMAAISAFAYGVVLATGLIHMVNEGIEKLSDECLGAIVEDYGCIGLAVVLVTMVLMHLIECEGVELYGSEGSGLHSHHHGTHDAAITVTTRQNSVVTPHFTGIPYHQKDLEKPAHNFRRKLATMIFEAGVAFHSVVIGLDLGISAGPEFKTLMTALCFHQFF
ncbi:unnamed protein product [Phytophthora lilii]|uniref:Unnamed protein product n=1 Tax=Phytophthora lilii TaxID=2077276 RepID=A0A9W6WQ25_9STRA|nr:unnamed protein product [Phytophthora lilii]